MDVAASVFKAYDIRGVVGQTINEAFAEHLGRAFGSEALAAGEKAVAVGRDGRVSGPALSAALIRGLASTGLDVDHPVFDDGSPDVDRRVHVTTPGQVTDRTPV